MPYVNYGLQMSQQYQYSYPSSYSNSYPSTSYSYPNYNSGYSYGNNTSYNTSVPNFPGYYYSQPQSTATQTGRKDFLQQPLCNWSDYSGAAMSCNKDPQQWVQDPYTGLWY